jgi:hypothetical protein
MINRYRQAEEAFLATKSVSMGRQIASRLLCLCSRNIALVCSFVSFVALVSGARTPQAWSTCALLFLSFSRPC